MDFNIKDFDLRLKSIKIWELVIGIVISFVFGLIFSEILPILNINVPAELLAQFFILIFFVYALRKTNNFKSSLTSAGDNWKEILYLFIINFFFGFFVLSFFSFFAPEISNNLFEPSPNLLSFIYVVISSVIIVPIIEELMFRGVILNVLNNRVNFIYAIIISSVLFSLFHGFGRLIPSFLFGLCMCVVYLKTNNITIPIIIHIINNATGTICTDLYNVGVIILANPLNSITFIISTISGILILFYLRKNIKVLCSSDT